MSHIMPDPRFDAPDEFDRLMSGVPLVSPWQAMFAEAQELLAEAYPGGFEVEEIGRNAFDALPESEKEEALDVLFYTYWAATQNDLEVRASYQAGESRG